MTQEKARLYAELAQQLAALIEGEPHLIANAANMAALIYHGLPDLNWAGFYFAKGNTELVLGPFQGKPACVRIAWGQGGVRHRRRAARDDPCPGCARLPRPHCLRPRLPLGTGHAAR